MNHFRKFFVVFFYGCMGFLLLHGLSLAAVSMNCSLVVVQGLLITVACMPGHVGFSSCGSQDLEHSFNSCGAWAQKLFGR